MDLIYQKFTTNKDCIWKPFTKSLHYLFLVCGETTALRAVLAAGASVSTPDIHGGYPLHYAAQMCGGVS